MTKRIVIDGGPGSGKTFLLNGRGQNPTDNPVESLKDKGYSINLESISIIGKQMHLEGKPPIENMQELLERTLQVEIELYLSTSGLDLAIHDKALPGYECFFDLFNLTPSQRFYNSLETMTYNSPIFVCCPILNFNFPQARDKSTVFSRERRLSIHEKIKADYKKRGYEIIELPIFSKDFGENNLLRMKLIQETIGFAVN